MFGNIEEKIKKSALIILFVEVLFFIVYAYKTFDEQKIFNGIMILVFGLLFSWISVLINYGFCELIKNSRIVAEKMNLYQNASEDKKAVLEEMKIRGVITKRDYFLEQLKLQHETEQITDKVYKEENNNKS